MPRHLSVATAIEKNRVASDKAFLILVEIAVQDDLGRLVETIRLARNSETYVYHGQPYQASNFNIDLTESADEEPSLKVDAFDPSGFIRERMETYGGGVGFPVKVLIVNTGNPDQPPEISEEFLIVDASQQGVQITFTLGVDNPLLQRFPNRLQYRDQCTVRYRGPRCKYAGPLLTCDYTRYGSNGCLAHDNSTNFGGFSGLQTLSNN